MRMTWQRRRKLALFHHIIIRKFFSPRTNFKSCLRRVNFDMQPNGFLLFFFFHLPKTTTRKIKQHNQSTTNRELPSSSLLFFLLVTSKATLIRYGYRIYLTLKKKKLQKVQRPAASADTDTISIDWED